MLKVLLVDDEPVALKALKVLINWSKLGYSVCGEARDGKTALQMILSQNPDVVVTDIRMPAMDGLTLIQQSRQQSQHRVRFIILSGYGDFQYAQQAIKFGVAEYLLKPVDENALVVVLTRLHEELTQEDRQEQMKRENAQSALRNKVLALCLSNRRPDEAQIASICQGLNIEDATLLRCIKLKFSGGSGGETPEAAADSIELIKKYLEKNYRFFSFDTGASHISALYFTEKQDPQQTLEFFAALQKELFRVFAVQIAIIVSMQVDGITGLPQARDSVVRLETSFYFYEQREVLLYEDYADLDCDYNVSDIFKTDIVVKGIAQRDFSSVSALLDEIFDSLKSKHVPIDAVRIFLNNIVIEIIRLINDLQGDFNAFLRANSTYINALDSMTAGDAKEMTLRLCLKTINYSDMLIKQNAKGIINDVEKYTMQNYMHELNLKIIADKLHINTAYLGQQFKKKTGMNYIDYLNEIRIDAAKKYLSTSNLKIYEIAEKVGFMNTDYFTSKFQKVEKMSPTEYRTQFENR